MKSLAVTRNVLRRITHDRRTLVLIALIPLFFVLLYGYSFSGKPQHLAIYVVNQDNGLASVRTATFGRITLDVGLGQAFVNALDPALFDVKLTDDAEYAQKQVYVEGIWAAIVLPQSFSHEVINEILATSGEQIVTYEGESVRVLPPENLETGPKPSLTLDDGNPVITSSVLQGLRSALESVLSGEQKAVSPDAILDIKPIYQGKVRSMDYTAPGIIGFAMTLITIMLTSISIVRERTGGTLTRVLIAPIRPWQVTLGYAIAFAGISLFQVGELFLVSKLLFGIRIAGGLGWIALIVSLYAVGLQGMATLISTIAKNEFQAMEFVLFLLIPSLMISGVFWPLEAMPPGIRPLSLASPLTYANNALRGIMLRGTGITGVGFDVSVLAGFALLMLAISVYSMRRQARSA